MENQTLYKSIIYLILSIISTYPFYRIFECLKALYIEYVSLKYAEIIGEIITSEVKFMIHTRSYRLILENSFRYEIDGNIYISKQNYASDFIMNSEYQTMDKFPFSNSIFSSFKDYENNLHYQDLQKETKKLIGSKVTIFHDSKNPKNSCLKKGFNFNTSLSLVMAFLGLGMIYYFLFILNLI